MQTRYVLINDGVQIPALVETGYPITDPVPCEYVVVQALYTNAKTERVWVALKPELRVWDNRDTKGPSAAEKRGLPLYPGERYTFWVTDAADLWISCANTTDGVNFQVYEDWARRRASGALSQSSNADARVFQEGA